MLFLMLGLLVGIGIAVHGWFLQATGASGGLTVVIKFLESYLGRKSIADEAQKVATVAVQYNIPRVAYWFLWGAVFGAGVALVVGYVGIYATAYVHYRRKQREDAFGVAGRAAARYLTRGLKGYLSAYEPGLDDVRAQFGVRRLRFHETLIENTRKVIVSNRLTPAMFRDLCEQLGATMLTTLFEPDGTIRNFRLAIYEFTDAGEKLTPIVTVNRGDWSSHSSKPLTTKASFLGCSIAEGQPLVYPRDKSGRKFERRGKTRWKSILTMPLPCGNSAPQWGGITVDHIGGDDVFTPERVEILRDFARTIETLYCLTRKEAA
jgi:GAF domain-containing protein